MGYFRLETSSCVSSRDVSHLRSRNREDPSLPDPATTSSRPLGPIAPMLIRGHRCRPRFWRFVWTGFGLPWASDPLHLRNSISSRLARPSSYFCMVDLGGIQDRNYLTRASDPQTVVHVCRLGTGWRIAAIPSQGVLQCRVGRTALNGHCNGRKTLARRSPARRPNISASRNFASASIDFFFSFPSIAPGLKIIDLDPHGGQDVAL